MNLKIQIISLLIAVFYGFIIRKAYNFFNKYFYLKNNIYSFLNSLLFILIIILIYFKINYIINKGNIKIYFIIISVTIFIILQKKCQNNRY